MWQLLSAMVRDKERVELYLKEGYEPFTVSPDVRGERVWFKKEVEDIEVYSKPKQPIKGRSGKNSSESKA